MDYEEDFDRFAPAFARLVEEVCFGLDLALRERHLKVHSITGRVKSKSSFVDKTMRKSYEDPMQQVEDIAGVRIVCLFLSELKILDEIVTQQFSILSSTDHLDEVNDDQFGYMSVHYVCQLHTSNSGPRYVGLQGLKFELQVRTLLMDAWANVSHHLDYKGEASIPTALRRDFYALSGLFYVADQHFELFYNNSERMQKEESATVQAGRRESVELNLNTVSELVEIMFPDRGPVDRRSASEFVEELAEAGYGSLAELEAKITQGLESALEEDERRSNSESEQSKMKPNGGFFTSVGMARTAVRNVDPNYVAINNRHAKRRARQAEQ